MQVDSFNVLIAKFDLYANFVTSFLIDKVCLGRALTFTELVEVLTRLKRRSEGDRKEERERGTERKKERKREREKVRKKERKKERESK